MADKIKVTILEDGTIKTETDVVSAANHQNAEGFLRTVFSFAGGLFTRKMKHSHGAHSHSHGHGEHEHQH